jgi:lysyl-tRNA synthetase class 2
VGAPYEALIEDCSRILAAAATAAGVTSLRYRDRLSDPFAAPERLTVADAFSRYAGVDLLATMDAQGRPDRDALAAQSARAGVSPSPDDTWSDLFSKLLVAHVEHRLGLGRPTALIEYPACEAALARPCAHDPRVAERFELYACGVELANAFGELTDPAEQRRRFEMEMDERARIYGEDERYPLDEDFLAALALMPDACGIALGVDRLVMLATGASRIDQVIWTPLAEIAP